MKAIITDVEKINNANLRMTVEYLDDKGEIIFKTTKPFLSLNQSTDDILADLKKNLKVIHSTYVAENNSKLYDSAISLIGKEIDLS